MAPGFLHSHDTKKAELAEPENRAEVMEEAAEEAGGQPTAPAVKKALEKREPRQMSATKAPTGKQLDELNPTVRTLGPERRPADTVTRALRAHRRAMLTHRVHAELAPAAKSRTTTCQPPPLTGSLDSTVSPVPVRALSRPPDTA